MGCFAVSSRSTIVPLSLLFLMGLHTQVWAQDADYARPGFYLMGGVAVGFENSDALEAANRDVQSLLDFFVAELIANGDLPPGSSVTAMLDIGVLAGVDLAAGYRLAPRVAVEGEFEWAKGSIDFIQRERIPFLPQGGRSLDAGTFSHWLLSANAKVFAFTGRVQPYALFGVGVMGEEIDLSKLDPTLKAENATGGGLRFGGGVDLYFSESVAIGAKVSYLLTLGDIKDNDVISLALGLLWRF